jgi:hypothetical protein
MRYKAFCITNGWSDGPSHGHNVAAATARFRASLLVVVGAAQVGVKQFGLADSAFYDHLMNRPCLLLCRLLQVTDTVACLLALASTCLTIHRLQAPFPDRSIFSFYFGELSSEIDLAAVTGRSD